MSNNYPHLEAVKEMVDTVLQYINTHHQTITKETNEFVISMNMKESSFGFEPCYAPDGVINISHVKPSNVIASSNKVVDFCSYYDCIREYDAVHNIQVGISFNCLRRFCEFIFCFHETLKEEFPRTNSSKLFELEITALGFTLHNL